MRSLVKGWFLSLTAVFFVVFGSVWAACPDGDLTGDCGVDFDDVRTFADQWLYPSGSFADIDGLSGVEGRDFAMLAGKWGQSGIPLEITNFNS